MALRECQFKRGFSLPHRLTASNFFLVLVCETEAGAVCEVVGEIVFEVVCGLVCGAVCEAVCGCGCSLTVNRSRIWLLMCIGVSLLR